MQGHQDGRLEKKIVCSAIKILLRIKTQKKSTLHKTVEPCQIMFSFSKLCILLGHLTMKGRHGGRALTRGGCLRKEIR